MPIFAKTSNTKIGFSFGDIKTKKKTILTETLWTPLMTKMSLTLPYINTFGRKNIDPLKILYVKIYTIG